jgi:hypothetical protein
VARGIFAQCIESGATADACRAQAAEAFEQCKADHCSDAPQDTCEEACAKRVQAAETQCLEAGHDPAACDKVVQEMKVRCLRERCAEPEPPCADRCKLDAEKGFEDCMAAGGTATDCDAAAEASASQCTTGCTSDSACADRCREKAQAVADECTAAGEPAERCAGRADEAGRHCIKEHCDGEDPGRPSCEALCEDHAQHDLRRCLADGGAPEDCAAAARAQFTDCNTLHCNVSGSCEDRCQKKADKALHHCEHRRADTTTCDETANHVFEVCRNEKCAPMPPDTCGTECEGNANATADQCEADGTSAADCQDASDGALDSCMESCGAAPDATCDERCEEVAQNLYDDLSGSGRGEARAARKAKRAYQRCVRTCGRRH